MKRISIQDFMCLNANTDMPVKYGVNGYDKGPWLNGGYPVYLPEAGIVAYREKDEDFDWDWGHIYWPKEYPDQKVYYGYYQEETYGATESQDFLNPRENVLVYKKLSMPGNAIQNNGFCALNSMAFALGVDMQELWIRIDEALYEKYGTFGGADDRPVYYEAKEITFEKGNHYDILNSRGQDIWKNFQTADEKVKDKKGREYARGASVSYLSEVAGMLNVSHIFESLSDSGIIQKLENNEYAYITTPTSQGNVNHMQIIYGYGYGEKTSWLYWFIWDPVQNNNDEPQRA